MTAMLCIFSCAQSGLSLMGCSRPPTRHWSQTQKSINHQSHDMQNQSNVYTPAQPATAALVQCRPLQAYPRRREPGPGLTLPFFRAPLLPQVLPVGRSVSDGDETHGQDDPRRVPSSLPGSCHHLTRGGAEDHQHLCQGGERGEGRGE